MSQAKSLSPINPKGMASAAGGGYQFDQAKPPASKGSTIPKAADHKSAMIDGPYGGKKPQS